MNKENSSTNLTIKITKYLLSKSVVHYVDLMEYTGLSRKTVSKYLDRVEKILKKEGVTLNRKRGSGIYLTGNLEHLGGVLPDCSDDAKDDDPRRISLLSFLLNSEKPILLDDLAEHFYISRSTLERDLNYLKEYFGVKLSKSNKGIISCNNELEIRQILSQLIQEHWNQRLIENTETGKMVQNFQIPDYLSEYIDPHLISRVQKVLVKFWQEYKIQANEYQYEPLLIHISISMKRISEEKYITEADILDLPISSETHYLIDLLEKEFEFNIPLTEAKYFEMYVAVFNDNFDSFGSLQVVSELTMWLKQTLPSYDDELLRNLAVHLVPALKRGKMGFSVKNPYAQEIKEKFPTAFDQALDLTLMIQKHFKIVLPENEIAYTALHLELFNKRHPHQDKDVSIMIVCSSGYGTSQLLRQRVLESIKDVNVIGTMSVADFIEKAPKADVVLSTVPLKMDRSRVIQVSPFLNETEVELVKKVCNEVRKKEYIHASFMELLRPECIIADSKLTDKKQVIKQLTDQPQRFNYVDSEMGRSALEREKLATTKLGQISIPHGGLEHVLKPTLGILTSKKGIVWDHGQSVHLVFFIAFNQQLESKMDDIYTYFYSLIKDQKVINCLVNATTRKEVISILAQNEFTD